DAARGGGMAAEFRGVEGDGNASARGVSADGCAVAAQFWAPVARGCDGAGADRAAGDRPRSSAPRPSAEGLFKDVAGYFSGCPPGPAAPEGAGSGPFSRRYRPSAAAIRGAAAGADARIAPCAVSVLAA